MGLREYKKKRDFDVTPEPAGAATIPNGRRYVIQKHAASRLHYDLRLEMNGVLKSWAVPKGPSLDPKKRTLAIQVEDHPLEYGGFEGVIPEGQYGGGTVMLWDAGEWMPIGAAEKDYRRGRLKFELHGRKLRGVWNLVRMRDGRRDKPNWLLIKQDDEFAQPASDGDITKDAPLSVATGRKMEEIADQAQAPARASRRGPAKRKTVSMQSGALKVQDIPGARTSPQPEFIGPQLATATAAAPDGDEWLHEEKFDGYRILCILRDGKARLMSRNEKDWTDRFPEVVHAAEALPIRNAIIDGEVVALNEKGASDFQELQNAMRSRFRNRLVYCVFDLPHCEGFDLTRTKLIDRRRLLRGLIEGHGGGRIRFSAHVQGRGPEVFQRACQMGLEGIVSKRADGPYSSLRTMSWRKIKCANEQEFVIGGFSDPAGSRVALGALLLGTYENGELIYRGRVGTGFDEKTLAALGERLGELETPRSAFANPPRERDIHWVRPTLVAAIRYSQITRDGVLRHPVYLGLREDKPAAEVKLETPVAAPQDSPVAEEPSPRKKAPAKARTPRKAGGSRKSASAGEVTLAGISLTHPGKVLDPGSGLTKIDLARYYVAVAERMLPHVAGRPLMLARCPGGVAGKCFYQKHVTDAPPAGMGGVTVQEKRARRELLILSDVSGLVGLAQIGALEVHTWAARADRIERPDRVIFDLDPGSGVEWSAVAQAAYELRDRLREAGLESFLKLSGGKGLHVYAPIERRWDWEEAGAFARGIAEQMAAAAPERFLVNMSKAKRAGKIFVDYLRTQRGSTCVAPYSTRARPGAPVSAPIAWEEATKFSSGAGVSVAEALERLKGPDPWAEMLTLRQRLRLA